VNPLKIFQQHVYTLTKLNIFYTHIATCISNDVIKFLENYSYSDSEIKL